MNAHSRFDPRNVLDADWRKRLWKRWLLRAFVDSARPSPLPVTPDGPITGDGTPENAATTRAPTSAVGSTITPPPLGSRPPPGLRDASRDVTRDSSREQQREQEARRNELRSRFDALFDRLASLEDTLDAFGKRFTLRAVHERRQEQRLLERIENSADMLERQALALESMQALLERVEQRLERVERRVRGVATGYDPSESRDSTMGAHPFSTDDLTELEAAFGEDPSSGHRSIPPESMDGPSIGTSSIHGNLSEMSLPTVFAMLELERRTGLLKVCGDDGTVVTATLRNGSIVGAKRREVDADPVDVMREAMRFGQGHFWFRQSNVEVVTGPPRSVGSVLLEASSRNDEAARSA